MSSPAAPQPRRSHGDEERLNGRLAPAQCPDPLGDEVRAGEIPRNDRGDHRRAANRPIPRGRHGPISAIARRTFSAKLAGSMAGSVRDRLDGVEHSRQTLRPDQAPARHLTHIEEVHFMSALDLRERLRMEPPTSTAELPPTKYILPSPRAAFPRRRMRSRTFSAPAGGRMAPCPPIGWPSPSAHHDPTHPDAAVPAGRHFLVERLVPWNRRSAPSVSTCVPAESKTRTCCARSSST